MEAIEGYHLTIALGPAGTGKTYLAVSATVAAFEAGEVGRIVLTRPAVEAGERLGYLPGDIGEKLAPYLRPLNDALNERLGGRRVKQLMTEGAIEIAPIAYMRGRTLNNAFIVNDEAQNCTYGQIKMMLPATFVVNARISGNRLSRNDAGPSALARFDRDVLSTPGFGMSFYSRALTTSVATTELRLTADDLIAGYRQAIQRAHTMGLFIYGGTMTPSAAPSTIH